MEQSNQQPPMFNQQGVQLTEERPIMGFKEAVRTCFAKYATFTGRARRSEYWWFCLFMALLSMVCSIFDGILKAACNVEFVETLASLFVLVPSISVSFRRLHDIGRSGWWAGASYILCAISVIIVLFMTGFDFSLLTDGESLYHTLSKSDKVIAVLPMLGGLVVCLIVFVFSLMDSQLEENKYGPSPKYQ